MGHAFGRLLHTLRREPADPVGRTLVRAAIFDQSQSVVSVVGESFRQDVLERVAGGLDAQGVMRRDHIAAVVSEPTNRVDAGALAVQLEGELVGYLARADGRRYQPVIDRVEAHGLRFGCHARLIGGWDRDGERGLIGVTLLVGTPADLWREMDEMFGTVPLPAAMDPTVSPAPIIIATVPVPADLIGKSVCFTGPSRFTFQGLDVSRAMQELLAVQHGMTVLPRVTKKLDILVVSEPGHATGKSTKATAYGTIVVDEAAFWTAVNVVF